MKENTKTTTRPNLCSRKDFIADTGKTCRWKRALSLTQKRCRTKGSLSLEAALSLPLFLLFCTAIISFLLILHVQTDIQASLGQTSRNIGKTAYLLDRIQSENAGEGGTGSLVGEGGTGSGASAGTDEEDFGTLSLISAGINSATIKLCLLTDSSLRKSVNNSRIQGGISGLYTYGTSFRESSGTLDIVVSYDYKAAWLPGSFGTMRFVQRMRGRVWTGESLTKKGTEGGDSDIRTVYITPTGSVYHLSPSCNYLDLSIHSISGSRVSSERNANGARYHRCELCASSGNYHTVYITDYGTSWHSSLGCSGLKRTVTAVDISEIGDLKVCSKCRQGIAHEH